MTPQDAWPLTRALLIIAKHLTAEGIADATNEMRGIADATEDEDEAGFLRALATAMENDHQKLADR